MVTGNLWQDQNPGAHTDLPFIHFQISADEKNKYSSFSNRGFMDKIQKPGDSGCNVVIRIFQRNNDFVVHINNDH